MVNAQPRSVVFAKVDNRQSDFYLLGYGVGSLNSHEMLRQFYRTQGSRNSPGYSNPQVDQLIDEIDRTMATYARDAMIERVWKIVLGDVSYIPLHSQVIVWVMRDNLDLPVLPVNQPLFREARLKEAGTLDALRQ